MTMCVWEKKRTQNIYVYITSLYLIRSNNSFLYDFMIDDLMIFKFGPESLSYVILNICDLTYPIHAQVTSMIRGGIPDQV